VDIARYSQACSELVNMTVMPHGPVTRRMGTQFIIEAAHAEARLVEFVYNTEQAYVLEFTPGKIRFFRDGGYLAGKDLATPYTAGDIGELNYCQAADLMYLVCPNVSPRKLTRPGADAFALAPVAFTAKPAEWGEGNWPGVVTFFQQRLWVSGCPKNPQKIWAGRTGDFENFTTGANDDDALSLSLVSEQVNAVRWLLSQKVLLAGTSGGEWTLHGGGDALTPANMQARLNSNYGAAAVRPAILGTDTVHVSADGRRLMSMGYDYGSDAYASQDLSLLGEHLTRGGIKQIANCRNPDGIVWCALNNGGFVGCTYLKNQEIVAWHRHETQGWVSGVCCIPGDGHTETWLVVRREHGYFIERMLPPWDGESTNEAGCWFVDSGLAREGEPALRVTGLGHLEGQEVNVLADGAQHPRRIVRDGAVDLDFPASRVIAGLPCRWRLAPMRLEGLSRRGTMQGKKTLLTELTARVYKTLDLHWERTESGKKYEVSFREARDGMDAAPPPFTGDVSLSLPGGFGPDARVRLSGDGPFPATVIMMVPKAAINE
jgi:hypothetical protein